MEAPNAGGVGLNGNFRQITHSNLKMVWVRGTVSIKVEEKVVCALPNGDIANDLERPSTTQITLFYTLGIAFHVAVMDKDKNFKLGRDINHNKSYHTDDK